MIEEIKIAFEKTKLLINSHKDYPKKLGIYAFYLSDNSILPNFGEKGQIIYVGIAKNSLHHRDFNQHFKTGKTGSSTLRRSIGAIMKESLKLTVIPRGGENDSKRLYNFKFVEEELLTDWMMLNLEIGYWVPIQTLNYKALRDIEKDVTISLKPCLDLDRRTKRFNPFAEELDKLRKICRIEASNSK